MQLRQLPADEQAARRFAEELWLPYNRELEDTVEGADALSAPLTDPELDFAGFIAVTARKPTRSRVGGSA